MGGGGLNLNQKFQSSFLKLEFGHFPERVGGVEPNTNLLTEFLSALVLTYSKEKGEELTMILTF